MAETTDVELRLEGIAKQVAVTLNLKNQKIVFAESCTGGKMASAMTAIPGISANFCGSAVTYRESTKKEWLSISASDLATHSAESESTTIEMAKRVLAQTSEADFSVAITGHLGPGVDAAIDGIVFVSVANKRFYELHQTTATRHQLRGLNRVERQTEAACVALEQFLITLGT